MLGNVKRFNPVKGYGFITGEDKNDYFFHFSELQMEGYKNVKEGEKVTFTPGKGDKGPVATNIQIV
ncbi:MAG: cold shock domain-containing protein [Erysipelotrichaceae bacterium]|nr:cold shock domain-containing protein [Erysipelotrichaceae bacterium]